MMKEEEDGRGEEGRRGKIPYERRRRRGEQ
jgi:hypothetical protein